MLFKALSVKYSLSPKFQLTSYGIVGAIRITYMLAKLLSLSVFSISKIIVLLPRRCQSLSLNLKLVTGCSGASDQLSQDVSSLPNLDQHKCVYRVSLELFRLACIKDMAPALG